MFGSKRQSVRKPDRHTADDLFKNAVLGNIRNQADGFDWSFDAPSEALLSHLHFIRELLAQLRGGRSPRDMVDALHRETNPKKVGRLAGELQHRHQEWDMTYSRLFQTLDQVDPNFRGPLCAIAPLRQVVEAVYKHRPGGVDAYLGNEVDRPAAEDGEVSSR